MTIEISYKTSINIAKNGSIVVVKEYADGRIEKLTFDDADDLESFIEEVSDLTPKRDCPKCGQPMTPIFVKEYDCEDCCTIYTDDVLDIDECKFNKDD